MIKSTLYSGFDCNIGCGGGGSVGPFEAHDVAISVGGNFEYMPPYGTYKILERLRTSMSLVLAVLLPTGVLLTSDTRNTVSNFRKTIALEHHDDFRKINQIDDHTFLAITNQNSVFSPNKNEGEKVSDIILSHNPKTALDVWDILNDDFCSEPSKHIDSVIAVISTFPFGMSVTSFRVCGSNLAQTQYTRLRDEINSDRGLPSFAMGETWATEYIGNIKFPIESVDDCVKTVRSLFSDLNHMSQRTKLQTIGPYMDILYYDFSKRKLRIIEQSSEP